MSRSRNTKPWKHREEDMLDASRKKFWTDNSGVRYLSRLYNRKDRHDAARELRKGDEPPPVQARGRAIWDAW